jgi:hypothetical protein
MAIIKYIRGVVGISGVSSDERHVCQCRVQMVESHCGRQPGLLG